MPNENHNFKHKKQKLIKRGREENVAQSLGWDEVKMLGDKLSVKLKRKNYIGVVKIDMNDKAAHIARNKARRAIKQFEGIVRGFER